VSCAITAITTTILVPHIPARLGGEVEELGGAVRLSVSIYVPLLILNAQCEMHATDTYSLGLTPTALPAASRSAAAREAALKSELLLRTV
jgi:hypothetical protein